ncbi:MAG: hypothetical protein JSW00_05625 [Thermoplasmata archaeon]|nr:MAG: hypothetical protein JSW00_05625 [Thermoplasmata archaeon]
MQDEKISIITEFNGRNIADAQEESTAIVIDIEEEMTLFFKWNNTYSSDLEVSGITIELTYLDLKIYSIPYDLDIITHAYSTSNYTIYQDLEPYLKQAGVNLVEGVYKIVCKLTYQILEEPVSTHELSTPLYIRIGGNLLTSVIGVAAIASTIVSGITGVGAIREVSKTIEVAKNINGVDNPKELAQLSSMPKGLTVVKTTDIPKETLKRTFESAKKYWEGKNCPKCLSDWARSTTICESCGITIEEAEKLFGNMIVNLSEKAKEPISKTARGMSLKVLERLLGVDTAIVHIVLKTMVDVGIAKTQIAPRFIIKKLITNGLKIVVTTIVFLQISGLKVVGMNLLILSIVLGSAIPFATGLVVEKTINKKI